MKIYPSVAAAIFAAIMSGPGIGAAQAVDVEAVRSPGDIGAALDSAPAGTSLLRVDGVPGSGTVQLDATALEAFGTWAYAVNDPWLNRRVRYTGVLLAGLSAPDGADVLAVAGDGYRFVIPAREYERWPVLLATDSDAGPLGDKGPVRVIFPYDVHDDVQAARNMSVWRLESLSIQ